MERHGFYTPEDRENAIMSVALTAVFITLVSFKIAFNYNYNTEFLTGLASGLGYVVFAGSMVGKEVLEFVGRIPYLNRKLIGVRLSYLIFPPMLLLILWLFNTSDGKSLSIIDFTLAYSLGSVAILTPKRIYDDREFRFFSFVTTQAFLIAIFYSTLKFSWAGLGAWTAIAFIFLGIMGYIHREPIKAKDELL